MPSTLSSELERRIRRAFEKQRKFLSYTKIGNFVYPRKTLLSEKLHLSLLERYIFTQHLKNGSITYHINKEKNVFLIRRFNRTVFIVGLSFLQKCTCRKVRLGYIGVILTKFSAKGVSKVVK